MVARHCPQTTAKINEMALRPIVTPPDPILRSKARKVRALTPELQVLIDDMIETMRAAPGVGLAAPQVGVPQRLIVIEYTEPSEDPDAPPKPPQLYVAINPVIVRHDREVESGVEGCLSLPGLAGDVERYSSVTVQATNRQGDTYRVRAQGWLARIFQHEIDHLDGVLFIDRATEVWRPEEEQTGTIAAD